MIQERAVLCGAVIAWLVAMPFGIGSSNRLGETSRQSDVRPGPDSARERAYRANNVGVAHLEQYDYDAAAASFRQALEIDATLPFARTNLALALFYANDADAAAVEARRAADEQRDAPQPHYLLGLIARSRNQPSDAAAEFSRVAAFDPSDVGTKVNLGQVYLQQARYADALVLFRAAVAAEPFNVTAAYNLAITLTRAGRKVEADEAMQRFQALRDSAYGVTYAQVYLQQGRYAEAVASTGLEPDLIDPATPGVVFADANAGLTASGSGSGGVTLADVDGEGGLDLIETGAGGARLFRNTAGRFADISAVAGLHRIGAGGPAIAALAADYDNDGRSDVLILREGGSVLLHQEADGRFADVSRVAGLPLPPGQPRSASFVDADHDGDLDIFIGGSTGSQLLRNNGNGTFVNVAVEAGLAGATDVWAVASTDIDNRRDVDLMMAGTGAMPRLFLNMRDGSFRDAATEMGLAADGPYSALAAADVNKDGFTDFFFGRSDRPGLLAISDARGRFVMSPALEASRGACAAQFADVDNDGALDLVLLTSTGPRVLRNLGRSWSDESRALFAGLRIPSIEHGALALGDLDGDGDIDIAARLDGHTSVWRNEGGNRNRSLTVRLTARVSNRSAVGSKVELRAGSLRGKIETVASTPASAPADVIFGLGDREGPDAVRVLWPAGILQTETEFAPRPADGAPAPLVVHELDRKPSSCPYLYTWNGHEFEFVTDFLGGGEFGAWEAPGLRRAPDPDEYVRIRGDQLQPRAGRYELRITNELEEALFLDRVQLVAVDHPADVDVYPNEGLRSPPSSEFRLYTAASAHPPVGAVDQDGRDVLQSIQKMDGRYADGFALDSIRGYASDHTLTLDVGDRSPAGTLLLLTGWTDYAFSSDNVAAHQRDLRLRPPSLEVSSNTERWLLAFADIGFPVGRPQTVVVDLSGLVHGPSRVRISTNMRIYWDQILLATPAEAPVSIKRLEPMDARLRWRGFSRESTTQGVDPLRFDYSRVTFDSPWKVFPGYYTREGGVRPLLTSTDDRFVISRPGDEVSLSFDATTLGSPRAGWARTFLLYSDGFSKEMDLNSSSPDRLAPLPFHGMTAYPYRTADADRDTENDGMHGHRYDTRLVGTMVPPLELVASQRERR